MEKKFVPRNFSVDFNEKTMLSGLGETGKAVVRAKNSISSARSRVSNAIDDATSSVTTTWTTERTSTTTNSLPYTPTQHPSQ
jgi:phage-related minor tail protein